MTRRFHDDESGAVLLIVGISLVALLGMLALTLDLGRVVAIRRDMVNAADAAALAAARECAIRHAPGATAAAQAAASQLTSQNMSGATVSSFSAPQCDVGSITGPRTVTVRTTIPVNYYIAPILGFGSTTVTTTAVAQYGPTAGAGAAPITVNVSALASCGIVANPPPPPGSSIDCVINYPKDSLSEPRWGVLDYTHWNDPNAAPCHVSASDEMNMINSGGYAPPVMLNASPPTYDCLDNGLSDSVWEALEGKTLLFPVIDINGQYSGFPSTGQTQQGQLDCTGAQPNCVIDTANVVAFILLYVPPGGITKQGSTVTVHAHWAGDQLATTGIPGTAPSFSMAVRLIG